MADDKQPDPLIQSLMALAVSAAPLIQRARDSGMFKSGSRAAEASDTVVEATVVPTPEPAPDFSSEKAALQAIIVSQAMKIAALEAEVARLTAQAAKAKRPKA